MFDAGELALVLLHLTDGHLRHGYDLMREVEALTGGAYAPSPGIIYPTLTLLEELHQIEVREAEGSKRVFALTDAGRIRLVEQKVVLERTLARLQSLPNDRGKEDDIGETGPIWRAMQNLRTVLQQHSVPSGDRQVIFDVADIIDEAARKIERLS